MRNVSKRFLLSLTLVVLLWGCQDQAAPSDGGVVLDETATNDAVGYPISDTAVNGYPIDQIAVRPSAIPIPSDLPVPTPEAGQAVVTGYIYSTQTQGYLVNAPVLLAEVYRNEEQDGAFVLDTASSPYAATDEYGRFIFTGIEGREYVVVVGSVEVNQYEILADSAGTAVIWDVKPGEVFDAGEVHVDIEW